MGQWLIDNCLTEIDCNDLNELEDSCSICREPLGCYSFGESSSTGTSSVSCKTLNSESKESRSSSQVPTVQENKSETPVRITTCSHVFGRNCITEWLQRSTTCPMCRTKLVCPEHKMLDRWRESRSKVIRLLNIMIRQSYVHDSAVTGATIQMIRIKQWILRNIPLDKVPDTLTKEIYMDLIRDPRASIVGVNDRDYTD